MIHTMMNHRGEKVQKFVARSFMENDTRLYALPAFRFGRFPAAEGDKDIVWECIGGILCPFLYIFVCL